MPADVPVVLMLTCLAAVCLCVCVKAPNGGLSEAEKQAYLAEKTGKK